MTYGVRPLLCQFGLYADDQIIAIFSNEEIARQTAENLNSANIVSGELQTVTHAEWAPLKTGRRRFICTNCYFESLAKTKFCSHCGAKMDKKENEK